MAISTNLTNALCTLTSSSVLYTIFWGAVGAIDRFQGMLHAFLLVHWRFHEFGYIEYSSAVAHKCRFVEEVGEYGE